MFDTRDSDVELALNDVHSARPVDLPFPFLTIDALADLTPRSITAENIRVYALNYKGVIPKHMAETETWMEKQSQLRNGEEEDEEDNNESSEEEDGDGSED